MNSGKGATRTKALPQLPVLDQLRQHRQQRQKLGVHARARGRPSRQQRRGSSRGGKNDGSNGPCARTTTIRTG
jgi:hypothetical protein